MMLVYNRTHWPGGWWWPLQMPQQQVKPRTYPRACRIHVVGGAVGAGTATCSDQILRHLPKPPPPHSLVQYVHALTNLTQAQCAVCLRACHPPAAGCHHHFQDLPVAAAACAVRLPQHTASWPHYQWVVWQWRAAIPRRGARARSMSLPTAGKALKTTGRACVRGLGL